MKAVGVIPAFLLTALVLIPSGLGLPDQTRTTARLAAHLDKAQQVPPQTVKVANASGSFSGTLVAERRRGVLTWRLTYSHLSSPPNGAFIQLGGRGKVGEAAVVLCWRKHCKPSTHGKLYLTRRVTRAILRGAAYVNIHTQKNPKGEIRGQIAALE